MSKVREGIDAELAAWIEKQHIFFVATSPLSESGHINCSPKGGDSLRVLGPLEVAYQDYTGSGAETAAHLRANGRIVLMFCALDGKPNVVRLHGKGQVFTPADPRFGELASHFSLNPGTRAIIHVQVIRVSTSCGYAVPTFDFCADRDILDKWAVAKGEEGLREYRTAKNTVSIDGLPALVSGKEAGLP